MQVTLRVEDDVVYSLARVATIGGNRFEALVDQALRAYLAQNPPKPLPEKKAAPLPPA